MKDNLVLTNLFHRPTRTMVSVLGIGVGVLLILFTIGLAEGTLRERAQRDANVGAELMIRASGIGGFGAEGFRLSTSMVGDLTKIEMVKSVIPLGITSVNAEDSNTGTRNIDGIEFDNYAAMVGLKIIQGRRFAESGDEAIIDTSWQQQKHLKVGDKISLWERNFTVVGTYEPAAGSRVKVSLKTMQEQLESDGKCNTFLVKLTDPARETETAQLISDKFPDLQIIPMRELEEIYGNSIPALNVFLNVVIGIAAVISALIILLTMYTTVTERTRQIGILKSMGMSKSGIALIIAQEALLISLLGVFSGIILTVLLSFILVKTTSMQVKLDINLMLMTLLIGLVGGAIGALYPAIRAARLDAVEALSYE
jgi:putative ABC transport system permease protein